MLTALLMSPLVTESILSSQVREIKSVYRKALNKISQNTIWKCHTSLSEINTLSNRTHRVLAIPQSTSRHSIVQSNCCVYLCSTTKTITKTQPKLVWKRFSCAIAIKTCSQILWLLPKITTSSKNGHSVQLLRKVTLPGLHTAMSWACWTVMKGFLGRAKLQRESNICHPRCVI